MILLEGKMEDIIQEKISADHLLYVSLKYTKTCDVIMNLLLRWRKMIDTALEKALEHANKKAIIQKIPENNIAKINELKKIFKKDKLVLNTLDFFLMLKKIENLRTERIGEFRKNVALKVIYRGEEILIDLEKLKEYADMLENFISSIKQFLHN
jgi:hypothetical protein